MLDELENITRILKNNFQIDHIKISNYDSFWAKKYIIWVLMKIIELSKNYNKKSYKSKGSWRIKLFITTLYINTVITKKLLIVLQKNSKKIVDTK